MLDSSLAMSLVLLVVPALSWLLVVFLRHRSTRCYVPGGSRSSGSAPDVPGLDLFFTLVFLVAGACTLFAWPALAAVQFVLSGCAIGFGMLNLRFNGGAVQLSGLTIMTALFAIGTVACFQHVGFLCLFPGIPLAFSAGQLAGMLVRHWLNSR